MKLKTTLCAVLLSLTSVSMIACSNGESSNGTNTSVTKVDNSLEAQLKTVDAEIAALEEQKTAVQADLLTSPELMAELTENYDVAAKAYNENDIKLTMIHKGHVFENSADIEKSNAYLKAERDEAKLALDEAKAVSKDATDEIKVIDINLASKNVDKTIIVKKIDVKALKAGQKTMTDKNDRDNNEMLINRKLKEIEALSMEQNREDYL